MNTGRIFKSKQNKKFTVIPNAILEDSNLSLRAIGLLCYLLKLPEDWVVHKSKLHKQVKDGRDSVMAAFDELVDQGYIKVEKVKGQKGRFVGYNYFITDDKCPIPENPEPEEPKPENPLTGSPNTGSQDVLNTISTKDGITKDAPGGAPAKKKTTYQIFIDIYDKWHKKNSDGDPPKIDGAAGNAAKSLIGYLNTRVEARAKTEQRELTEEGKDQAMLDSWQIILDNWGLLEPFYQDKTRLIDINSNIQNVIKQIKDARKNGKSKAKSGGNNSKTAGITEAISYAMAGDNEGTDF